MNYQEALTYLYNIAPPFHDVGAKAYKPGLETMQKLMAAIDSRRSSHPTAPACGGPATFDCPVIHVAGTNGKGSTSHLIAAALAAAGMRVGLYTSPHLVSFCERVRVIEREETGKGQSAIRPRLIPEAYVAEFVGSNKSLFEQLQPSFFEITTAMAFCWLREQKVDVAVIEVGLGGLLDATNIVSPCLTVITNIGYDHTDLLGHTLAEIAEQKAGIMKPGVPCVIGESNPETQSVFLRRAEECGILGEGLETTDCKIWFADECEFLRRQRLRVAPECELKGDYQQKNMQTAFVALKAVSRQLPAISNQAIAGGFAHVVRYTGLRGRWEVLSLAPKVICDTGHNSHGIATYVEQLRQLTAQPTANPSLLTANRYLHIVFGIVADKDVDAVLRLLPEEATYYFTQPNSHRALPAEELLGKWKVLHPMSKATAYKTVNEALTSAHAAATQEDVIFIGGSNYVVGEAMKYYDN